MIPDELETELLKRLKKVEGQVRGIVKMIEERRYCVDIVMQVAAVEAALHKVSEIILRNHILTCVMTAFTCGDEQEIQRKVDELMSIYSKFRPK